MKAAILRQMQTMRHLLSRLATRFRSDALFRFDVAAAATFCVSVTWSLGLFLTCGSPLHAWRWAGNHLAYGLWKTFIMPIAVGTMFGTLRFEPPAANRRDARGRGPLGIGLILAVVGVLTVVAFGVDKVEPYMLRDKTHLDTELDARRSYWDSYEKGVEPEKCTPDTYDDAMKNWLDQPSSLSWNACLNPLLTWLFGSFVLWYISYSFTVLRTGKLGGQGPTLGRLAFVAGLICLWLPFRHYADWHNSYFWKRQANLVWSYLLIVAVVYWSVLGIAAWKQRARPVVPRARTSIPIVLLTVANVILVLLALATHVRQILPNPPRLDDVYHEIELGIGGMDLEGKGQAEDLTRALFVLVFAIGLFVFAYLAARRQFAPEGEGADEQHGEAGAADDETDVVKHVSAAATAEPEPSPEDREIQPEEVLRQLSPAPRIAYWSFVYAESKLGRRLKDREAWDYLRDEGLPDDCGQLGELAEYEVPSYKAWSRSLRRARRALGEQKNHPRGGRPHGPSIVDGDDL